ncbi:hypothetical protein BCR34DRAFT_563656 [Clohesyomyces aquaticus]|uniref:CorA-like transporter domain-containing protein n=1 Tax=Clohesyomyces aquaticus TaxID=1231657 RepID=A0A1Y1ZQL3_9PLEO|nr:hypothetical protein BCR34DRAFT_563656 [Clohesyomyces aquaticus]
MATIAPQQANTFFENSYKDYKNYPTNLVYRASYRKVLQSYQKRLEKASAKLFNNEGTKGDQIDVRFRDYNVAQGKFDEVQKDEIDNLTSMRVYLGDVSTATSWKFNKRDPKCRYVLIASEMNRMQLHISRVMTNLLLSFHQVMPSYLDFMSVFGLQLDQRDLRFSGFHEQTTLGVPQSKRPAVPQLGRSGHGYQLCYNLKAVVDKGGEGKRKEWSKRHAAIHHQFDVDNGTALWICTEGRKKDGLFDRIRDLTSDDKRKEDWSYGSKEESFISSLATHLTCCHWSIEEWRMYMGWLEETVEKETLAAISGSRNPIEGVDRKNYTSDDLQLVQGYEDQVNEVIMILEANNDIMKSLSDFYDSLLKNDAFDAGLKDQCKENIREFVEQIGDMIYDANMQIRRAKLLVKITADRKALVLQHLQGQATEATLNLTYMSYKETIIMRIITIVTLIYLPATFVSTFFSTDVVKYQGQDASGSFSSTAMFRWLQVTLPLSAITLGVGYAWYRYQTKKSKKRGMYVLPY